MEGLKDQKFEVSSLTGPVKSKAAGSSQRMNMREKFKTEASSHQSRNNITDFSKTKAKPGAKQGNQRGEKGTINSRKMLSKSFEREFKIFLVNNQGGLNFPIVRNLFR
ncbi:hypothetical protein TorRG33x02_184540 [Trema orientale]|uniref:Uncharacterized protein n=1 Tax=Trema orientale TaxID=63057 RepID=A0A2P5EJK7_TREOI|nr:hypothetical protein TorRG33x02_184540 [Trema orientale]